MVEVKTKQTSRKQIKPLQGKSNDTSKSLRPSTLRGHFTIREHFGSKPIGECFREFLERVYPDLLPSMLRKEEG